MLIKGNAIATFEVQYIYIVGCPKVHRLIEGFTNRTIITQRNCVPHMCCFLTNVISDTVIRINRPYVRCRALGLLFRGLSFTLFDISTLTGE